jgi:Curlin associated repeat
MPIRTLILALALTMPSLALAQTNRAAVEQVGQANSAAGAQRGVYDRLAITQRGRGQSAAITQNGNRNNGEIHQFGRNQSAVIAQSGDNNNACLVQMGRNADAEIVQNGGDRVAVLQTPNGTREIPAAACRDGRVARAILRVLGRR